MSINALHHVIQRVQTVHRRTELIATIIRSGAMAFGAAGTVKVALTLLWHTPSPYTFWVLFAVTGASYALMTHRSPLSLRDAARMIDDRLNLKDRLSTAVEWEQKPSALAPWLLKDAAMHARFVDTKTVVPPLSLSEKSFRLPFILAAIALFLSWLPLPHGLLTASSPTDVTTPSSDRSSDDLAEEIESLRELLRDQTSPSLQRFEQDLARLHMGLREKLLPKDEAVSLLEHLQKRIDAALAEAPPPGQAPADLQSLQTLAENVTPALFQPLGAEATDVSPPQLPLVSEIPADASGSSETEGTSSQERAPGQDGDGETSGLRTDAENQEGQRGIGFPSPSADETPDEEAALTETMTGAGADEGGGYDVFRRPGGHRLLEHVTGEHGEGPIHEGRVQTTAHGEAPAVAGQTTGPPGAHPPAPPPGVEREHTPLAYRNVVRRYFDALEPDS